MHIHSPIDKRGRRRRRSKIQPRGKTYRDSPQLLKLVHTMYGCGPLSRAYMQVAYGSKNLNTFQKGCTRWTHGTALKPPMFWKPPELTRRAGYLSEPDIYDLTDHALEYLDAHGLLSPHIKRTDEYPHRFMGSCITFSTELGVSESGLRYKSLHEILSARGASLELKLSSFSAQKSLTPDWLWGIEYPDGERHFVDEFDRGTEQGKKRKDSNTSIEQKFEGHIDVMLREEYRRAWGIKNYMVRVLTVGLGRAQNMMVIAARVAKAKGAPELAENFIFQAYPTFGEDWSAPPVLLASHIDAFIKQRIEAERERIAADPAFEAELVAYYHRLYPSLLDRYYQVGGRTFDIAQ